MRKLLPRLLLSGVPLFLWPDILPAADAPTSSPTPTPAAESSARAILRRSVEPVVNLFAHTADGPNHAWVLRLRLAESNVHPAELLGGVFNVRLLTAPADKVFFQYPALGTTITVCRQGQTAWASPASRLAPLLQKIEATPPTAADRKPLAPIKLPVPEPLVWVGFYLTGVKDLGVQTVGGVPCRAMDVDPPDGEQKVSATNYTRLFFRADNAQCVRFERRHNADRSVYVIEQNRIAATLPDSDFQPTAAQRADLLEVPVERFRALMKAIGDEEEKRRKELREHRGQ